MIPSLKVRIQSIDIFRALTMFFMIFVNDLPTLVSYPSWLGHMPADEDALGFSDIIFPAFLFIVGLSIPFAIRARRKKGDSTIQIIWHIVQRSFALIIMGVLMVNLENINEVSLPFSKYWWQILMTLSFLLIWNNYPNQKAFKRIPQWVMILIGWLIIAFLIYIYKGGTPDQPTRMQTHWWGILGLIGWAYLLCALIYLATSNRVWSSIGVFILLYLMNSLEFVDDFEWLKFVVSASNHALVWSGIIATMLFIQYKEEGNEKAFLMGLILAGILTMAFGLISRPIWGISKIYATPSWTSITASISYLAYIVLYILTDKFKRADWARIFRPAGRSTLTCYLIPYFFYAIVALLGLTLPSYFLTGWIGILKSLLFSLLIIQITWGFEKLKIRLKI